MDQFLLLEWALSTLSLHLTSGPAPSGLCMANASSPLSGLFLNDNHLTGVLDVSTCESLFILEVASNALTGTLMVPPLKSNSIKIADVSKNSFDIVTTMGALMNSSQLMTLNFNGNAYVDTTNVAGT